MIVLGTVLALAVWTAVLVAGALEGWWRQPLAPSGDTRAFMDAAIAEIDRTRRGNVAFVLIEDGQVFDEHFTSVGQPVDRDTLFQVASMSKWITAWGVMTLVEAGTLDLDAPVVDLSHALVPAEDRVRQRRRHGPPAAQPHGGIDRRARLRRIRARPAGAATRGVLDPCGRRVARCRRGGSSRYRAGKRFEYSGGGYTLLQLMIEEVTGQSFNDYMRSAVFEPLGMTRSTYSLEGASTTNIAEFYDVDGTPAIHYRFTSLAATSLYTSAADMTRFIQAHAIGPSGEPAGRGRPRTQDSRRDAPPARLAVGGRHLGSRHDALCRQQRRRLRHRPRRQQRSGDQHRSTAGSRDRKRRRRSGDRQSVAGDDHGR